MFKKNLSKESINRHKFELFYSIFLILIIPGLIALNTLLFTSRAQSDFDVELRRKADLANEVFGSIVKSNLDSIDVVQSAVDEIVENTSDVTDIKIVQYNDGQGQVVASWDRGFIGSSVDSLAESLQFTIVVQQEQSVAQLIENNGTRLWQIVTPVFNGDNLVLTSSITVSLEQADLLISTSLQRSFVVLAITTLVVILLLWNHFRFVSYSQLYRKLKEADQLKNDFLSVATHELKAPLSTIKGYASNILDGTFGVVEERTKQSLEMIMNQSDRLNNLVLDLLNVSRIEQGRIEYKISNFEAIELTATVIDQLKPKAEEKDIKIVFKHENENAYIKADKNRYQEILINLIDNAIKYSKHGLVTLSISADDKNTVVSVRDTGIGMTADERERLFQRFYRIKNDDTSSISGTGLGLWIIKQYIEAMDGHISVDSLKGRGSEFSVTLPSGQQEADDSTE